MSSDASFGSTGTLRAPGHLGDAAANNIQTNLTMWDNDKNWHEHGDEWKGQAQICGIPDD